MAQGLMTLLLDGKGDVSDGIGLPRIALPMGDVASGAGSTRRMGNVNPEIGVGASLDEHLKNLPPNPSRRSMSSQAEAKESDSTATISEECASSSTDEALGEDRPWKSNQPFRYPLHEHEKGVNAWETCNELARDYDKRMCDTWRDEVDKLLIFAGLFSAAVTAFTIESYKMLQPDPSDTAAVLLAQIVSQLSSSTQNNATFGAAALPVGTFSPGTAAVRINICWFLSLTLSLTTVLVGILCVQWIREYQRDEYLPHQEALTLRQMRYEGLLKWHVPSILSGLPLLLQSALVLFFAGLLDLLWTLNNTVALVITLVVALVMAFLVGTTILPTLQCCFFGQRYLRAAQCPFKSPQSWTFHRLGRVCALVLFTAVEFVTRRIWRQPSDVESGTGDASLFRRVPQMLDWHYYDLYWRKIRDSVPVSDPLYQRDVANGLGWVGTTFLQNLNAVQAVHRCLRELWPYSGGIKMLAAMYSREWVPPPPPHGPLGYEAWMDLVSAHTLQFFAEQNPKLSHQLLLHRLELYVRVKNALTDGSNADMLKDGNATKPGVSLHFPLDLPDIHPLTQDIKIQLLRCLTSLLTKNIATQADANMMWGIALECLKTPGEIDPILHRELENGFHALNAWVSGSLHSPTTMDPSLTAWMWPLVKLVWSMVDFSEFQPSVTSISQQLCGIFEADTRFCTTVEDKEMWDVGRTVARHLFKNGHNVPHHVHHGASIET